LLSILVAGVRRRRGARRALDDDTRLPDDATAPTLPEPPPVRPLMPAPALAVALPVAAIVAAGFGLRAGAVAVPAVFLVLWRGASDRLLALLAGVLLGIAVPVVYVVAGLLSPDRIAGNSTQYGADRIAAHWMAVGAVVALAIILWRTLAAAVLARRRPPLASRR
jgi:hypothetical protein